MDVKAIKFVMNTPFSAWDEREKADFTVYSLKATLTREDTSSSVVEVSKRYSQFDELHEAVCAFECITLLTSSSSRRSSRR